MPSSRSCSATASAGASPTTRCGPRPRPRWSRSSRASRAGSRPAARHGFDTHRCQHPSRGVEQMSELLRSYRALPLLQQVVVGALVVVAALFVLWLLPRILGAAFAIGFALLGLAFGLAILAAIVIAVYAIARRV